MIRKFDIEDIDRVSEIWLKSNIETHDFIKKEYWEKNYPIVRELFLSAEIYVYEVNSKILGFIGLMDNFIAGIFIDGEYRDRGIGKKLIDFIKTLYDSLILTVYEKNKRAISFYIREGFIIEKESCEENNEKEYLMRWQSRKGEICKSY